MTQEYLAGELSQLLAELRTVAEKDPTLAREVIALRRDAETRPPSTLRPVVVRTLAVGDALCWHSLSRGDAEIFFGQAVAVRNVHEFGVCSGLIDA